MGNQEVVDVSGHYSSLVEYCRTDRQRQVVGLLASGLSQRQVCRELGCARSSVSDVVAAVKRYAAVKGVDDDHDINHPCSDAYIVKGTSTLYGSDGQLKAQWIKTTLDQDRLRILQEQMAAEFARTLPRYKPQGGVSANKRPYQALLAAYPIADVHLGQLAWGPETGNDYDLEIAERTIKDTVSSLIDRSPACEECLVENLGDLLHVDNQRNQTERGGNSLDVDGRYAKLLQAGIRSIRYVIEYALAKHKNVTVVNCCGNHDDLGSLWMAAALKNIYENEKRLRVVDSPAPRHYYRYGKTLIGSMHGQDVKPKDLPLVMAAERAEDWGSTRFHTWHIGHVHHDSVCEYGGCTVESFRAVCAKDAWTNSKGYMSGRDMKALFYDPMLGEVERHIVAIR